ncbi:MAG: hypothetical protein ACK4UN_06830, partial [Limisphaerales bacterium]
RAGRYGQSADYLNCPMTEEEYRRFYEALVAASAEVAKHKQTADRAMQTRREMQKSAEKGLRLLLSELHQVLTPLDSRWLAFGFNRRVPGRFLRPRIS